MKAVYDRLEEGKHAVLLVEETNQEYVLDKEMLPEGSRPLDWFEITMEGGEITSILRDPEAAAAQKEKVKNKRRRLQKRSKGSRFKRQ
ncbi:DUF3006 domain-containing protein [Halobacillus andaensis]|uniref:DUF3006 domain-containing protein n=1 Tax=Halobacillus andaensis TaxID=1176239 RepID=UPI003D70E696